MSNFLTNCQHWKIYFAVNVNILCTGNVQVLPRNCGSKTGVKPPDEQHSNGCKWDKKKKFRDAKNTFEFRM